MIGAFRPAKPVLMILFVVTTASLEAATCQSVTTVTEEGT